MNLERRFASRGAIGGGLALLVTASIGTHLARPSDDRQPPTAKVTKQDLVIRLVESGVLRAGNYSIYRSPFAGRETEVTFLAPEGMQVRRGDLVARVDSSEAEAELERAVQAGRQAELDLQVANGQVDDAQAATESLSNGEAALAPEEARIAAEAARRRVRRLQEDHDSLEPLLARGFITRDEFQHVTAELAEAQEQLRLLQLRARMLVERTQPLQRRQASFQLTQRQAQAAYAAIRLEEARARVASIGEAIRGASLYAQQDGVVVYEDYIAASPRRKIRVGDRVTASQGLVAIPANASFRFETTVRESDVARVRAGLQADVTLEAFPGHRFRGRVRSVGSVVPQTSDRMSEERRFAVLLDIGAMRADLRPEMTGRAEIVVDIRRQVLAVPIGAVSCAGSTPEVSVVTWSGKRSVPVVVGAATDSMVEVSGLLEGTEVLGWASTEREDDH